VLIVIADYYVSDTPTRRPPTYYTHGDQVMTASEWAMFLGVGYDEFYDEIRAQGDSVEKAIAVILQEFGDWDLFGRFCYPPEDLGDYGRYEGERPDGITDADWVRLQCWEMCAPDGSLHTLDPRTHQVTDHGEGVITVHPEIKTQTWEGWLVRGRWTKD
jgi:hypothetical protein